MSLGLHNFVKEINGWCWFSKSMSLFTISLEHWACSSGLVGLSSAMARRWRCTQLAAFATATARLGWPGAAVGCGGFGCGLDRRDPVAMMLCGLAWLGLDPGLETSGRMSCADRWAGLSFQKGLDVSTSMGWLSRKASTNCISNWSTIHYLG